MVCSLLRPIEWLSVQGVRLRCLFSRYREFVGRMELDGQIRVCGKRWYTPKNAKKPDRHCPSRRSLGWICLDEAIQNLEGRTG